MNQNQSLNEINQTQQIKIELHKNIQILRESLPLLGAQCDALTGDGLLARPMHESASPLETVLRVLEVEVLNKIGIPVSLAGKTLRGDPAKDWPTSLSAPRPDSGHILPEAGLQW